MKVDRQKELIGYLKLVFSILVAMNISAFAWLFNNFEHRNIKFFVVLFFVFLLSFAIIYLNKKILEKIDELEEL
ncbi:MAG: hypothetical protein GXO62_03575 [Epsilonproteobacteria bacterium]|nr:hypothetical protein [Campylobacterota bacterium]